MLYTRDLPKHLWAEAVNTVVYILNRTPTTQTPNSTPFEMWYDKKPSLDHIRLFGSETYVFVPKQSRTKLESKGRKLILVGYDKDSTNYRLFDPITKKITISRHITFNEATEVKLPRRNTVLVQLEDCRDENIQPLEEKEDIGDKQQPEEKQDKVQIEDKNEYYDQGKLYTLQNAMKLIL